MRLLGLEQTGETGEMTMLLIPEPHVLSLLTALPREGHLPWTLLSSPTLCLGSLGLSD